METELPEKSDRDENTGNVGNQPAGVTNYLEDGVISCFIHLVLIKSLPCMSKRGVHVDQCLSLLSTFKVEVDMALEIMRNIRALIKLIFNSK